MNSKKYEIDMTGGSLLKSIIMYSVPLILSGVLQLFYNAADVIVVGRFAGRESLAAVGSTTSITNLIVNLFLGLSTGVTVLISQEYGAKDYGSVHRAVHTAVGLSIIGGTLAGVLGFFASRQLLTFMGTPEDVINKSTLYMRIIFIGAPANMFYNFGSAVLRSFGDTRRPLYFSVIAGVINVILNLIFVILFKMDVAGVALATIISQFISAALIIKCLTGSTEFYKLTLKKIKIHKKELLKILRVGVPAGLQSAIFSTSNVLIQSSVNFFGSTVMAGNAAAQNIEGFVYTSMLAFHHASTTCAAQNYGAGNIKRVKRGIITTVCLVTAVGMIIGGSVYLFSHTLIGIYSPNEDVIMAGMARNKIITNTYFLCGIMDVLMGALRGLGYSLLPMTVSLLGACGLRILWVFTVFASNKTTTTLYMSYPITWTITLTVHLICLIIILRKKSRLAKSENLPS